jgi:fatty-acyl-CoA synthase
MTGDDEIGWIARLGRVPLGYLDDREQTERTFPIVDGTRIAVPGDRGRVAADGTIELLGRDSMVVNSGGEKIFVEEVEETVRRHPDVLDALVVGRPSERFGEEVVALVQRRGRRVDRSVQGAARGAVLRARRPPSLGQGRLPLGTRSRAWRDSCRRDLTPCLWSPTSLSSQSRRCCAAMVSAMATSARS